MSDASRTTVGFIGLGSMGEPMAQRLGAAGFSLRLLDTAADRAQRLAQDLGGSARVVNSARELAQESDVIITMLPNSACVQTVLEGDNGVLAGLRPRTVWLDMTSGIPQKTQEFAVRVSERDAFFVDAPVSGGVPRARAGDLSIMVGGDPLAIDRVVPVLEALGSSLTRTGDVGTAHAMKALNNLVSAGGFLIGIEALMIGQRFGLDPDLMVDVLNASTGCNNSTQRKFKQFVLSRTFDSGFGLDLMVKDLSIALTIAANQQTPAPFSSLCRELWASAQGLLGNGQDHTAVTRLVEALAGDELAAADQ